MFKVFILLMLGFVFILQTKNQPHKFKMKCGNLMLFNKFFKNIFKNYIANLFSVL